jgi:hypothetical protein
MSAVGAMRTRAPCLLVKLASEHLNAQSVSANVTVFFSAISSPTKPLRIAVDTAAEQLITSNLQKMLLTCVLTVPSVIKSFAPISLFDFHPLTDAYAQPNQSPVTNYQSPLNVSLLTSHGR